MDTDDRIYLDLKGARERLCRAQVNVDGPARTWLQTAIDRIDSVATFHCPQWSNYDLPTTVLDDE